MPDEADRRPVLEGRVAIVTGSGGGLGRAEALELARQGARVVVNDFGLTLEGEPENNAADETVAAIKEAGGEAVAHRGDVASWDDAKALVGLAVETFGGLDILVNNAGFLRDRMIFSMTEKDFDDVVRVHLKGHFCMMRHATEYWRAQSKAVDGPIGARVVNTASESALIGSPGQPNYGPAKAGVIALSMTAAMSLTKYGVNVNVIAPRARTRMTTTTPSIQAAGPDETGFDPYAPENVTPLVAFLASPAAAKVNGQVFIVQGRTISLLHGPSVERKFEVDDRWTSAGVAAQLVPFYEDRKFLEEGYLLTYGPARTAI
jgi:3-oxoacyl-[acyl-carrier protein] reductase